MIWRASRHFGFFLPAPCHLTIIEDGCFGTQPDCTVKVGDTYCHSFRTGYTKPMHMLSEEQDYHENEDRPMKYVWRSDARILKVLKEFRHEDGSQPPDLQLLQRGTTPVERLRYLALKYDIIDSKEKKNCNSSVKAIDLSEDEMKHLLEAEDLMTTGNSKVLRRRCQTHNLPTTRNVTTGLYPHWMGQAKGLMQIYIERGLVPLEKTLVSKYYSKEGKKVADEVDLDTSYIYLLSQCKDFKNE